MQISWHGHSCVKIETQGKVILIDPFIEGNPFSDLDSTKVKADYILVTHAHSDHLGDTVAIAKRNQALVITNLELGSYLETLGVKVHLMQPGGSYQFNIGKIKMTPAIHGSSLEIAGVPVTLGLAGGFLLYLEGKVIYHAGDTALFSDMKLIGEAKIDLAFLPIGDNYTMGIEDALKATEFLNPKQVIPIHYNTFELIKQDPQKFVEGLKPKQAQIPKVGAVIDC